MKTQRAIIIIIIIIIQTSLNSPHPERHNATSDGRVPSRCVHSPRLGAVDGNLGLTFVSCAIFLHILICIWSSYSSWSAFGNSAAVPFTVDPGPGDCAALPAPEAITPEGTSQTGGR